MDIGAEERGIGLGLADVLFAFVENSYVGQQSQGLRITRIWHYRISIAML